MQKLSACRKRGSLIQRRRSTSSACMIAICPAGPPKLMKPSLSQKRKASAKLAKAGAATASPILSGVAITRGFSSMAGIAVSLLSDSQVISARNDERAFFARSRRFVGWVMEPTRKLRYSAGINHYSQRSDTRMTAQLAHSLDLYLASVERAPACISADGSLAF